jgi:Xaa-Pro aminopeptidase
MERPDVAQFAHGQFRADYELRPDPHALREQRVELARRAMRDAGLDALLLWKNENVRYLTGLRAQLIAGKSALLNGCILPAEGPPILLASGGEIERCRMIMPWVEELHAVPIMEARGLVRATVEGVIGPALARQDAGRVGVDEAAMCQVEALRDLLPAIDFTDGDAPMQLARRVKLPGELALMQEACARQSRSRRSTPSVPGCASSTWSPRRCTRSSASAARRRT